MKTRVIVGVLCALFAIGCLVLTGYGYGVYLSIIISAVSGICIHEIFGVTGCKNKVLEVVSIIFSVLVCPYFAFGIDKKIGISTGIIFAIYILALLIIMLKMYDKTRFEHIAISVFCPAAIPMAMGCLIRVSTFSSAYPEIFRPANCVFFILMAMYCAWLCDTFALFSGKGFGKHKLAPNISPKKTVEGAIGGIVGTTLVSMITWFFFDRFYFANDFIKWWMVIIGIPVICIMGMCGDLAASVIKRNYGVKDFGNLLPGHGGAMDRVDSFLFTMPSMYILIQIILSVKL